MIDNIGIRLQTNIIRSYYQNEAMCFNSSYLHILANTEGLHRLPRVFKLQSCLQSHHWVFSCKLGYKSRQEIILIFFTEITTSL